jgi:outer membrane protein assembly factor BamB
MVYLASNVALQSLNDITQHTFTSLGGALVALNARTGALRWKGAIQPGKVIAGVALIVNGDTIYTISPGFVAAWNTSRGSPLWQRTFQSDPQDFQQALFADGVIYLSRDGVPKPACGGIQALPSVSALRASDGALLWKTFVPAT